MSEKPEKDDFWERETATEEALRALALLETFEVRIWASAFVLATTEVEAIDYDDAIKKVAAWDIDMMKLEDLDFSLGDNDNIFGDYEATIVSLDGNTHTDIALNEPGIPFSAEARSIVMMLAECDVFDNVKLSDLIKQARKACGKD